VGSVRGPMGSQPQMGAGTSGNWASSQPDTAPAVVPKKSNAGLFAGLAVVGVLVMGGAAFGAYSILGKKADDKKAEPSAAASSRPTLAAAAELKPEAAAVASATPPAIASETPAPSAAASAAVAEAAPSAAPSAVAPAIVDGKRPLAPVAARPLAPRPAAPAAKPPSKANGAKGGTPDFGY